MHGLAACRVVCTRSLLALLVLGMCCGQLAGEPPALILVAPMPAGAPSRKGCPAWPCWHTWVLLVGWGASCLILMAPGPMPAGVPSQKGCPAWPCWHAGVLLVDVRYWPNGLPAFVWASWLGLGPQALDKKNVDFTIINSHNMRKHNRNNSKYMELTTQY